MMTQQEQLKSPVAEINQTISGFICPQPLNLSTCQTVSLSVYQNSQSPEVDYTQSAPFWGVAFTSVLLLWLFSHGIGHILKLVKHA